MNGLQRILIGAVGGFLAVLAKFIAQDQSFVAHYASVGDPRLNEIIWGYAIATPILVFIGAVVAGFTDEINKLKLLSMAVSAPALITTWAGGIAAPPAANPSSHQLGPAGWNLPFSPVSTAFAGEATIRVAELSTLQKGVDAFFGGGKGEQRYWVIVGASTDQETARALSQSINQQKPDMKAFVGKRAPGNNLYPVIVGDYVSQAEATRLQSAAAQLSGVTQPYLSMFPDRRP